MKNFIKVLTASILTLSITACGGGSDGSIGSGTAPPTNNVPTANAGADKSVEVNKSISITGTGTDSDGTISTYKWSKGTTLLSTSASFNYTPKNAGTDTLTLTVTDNDGATGSDSVDVSVSTLNTGSLYSYIPSTVDDKLAHSFLLKSTFGPTPELINDIKSQGIISWVDGQLNATSAYDNDNDNHLPYLNRLLELSKITNSANFPNTIEEYIDPTNNINFNAGHHYHVNRNFTSIWFETAIESEDQLRQKVAYALSQIVVVSDKETSLYDRSESLAHYYDILARNAFAKYKDILLEVSKSPAMGIYLTHQGSKKYDSTTNQQPDENYARELMQLFTIGLNELNLDGTKKIDTNGNEIPTYQQTDVEELAKVFTGWDLVNNKSYGDARVNYGNFLTPMEFTSIYHETASKEVLGESIPAGLSGVEDIEAAIDILMSHDNIAPFVSKKLIMRLVSSNPSSAYVERVATVFNDNGSGEKGDLKAVVKAILLDEEAIVPRSFSHHAGKSKEPLLAFLEMLIHFDVAPFEGWISSSPTYKAYRFNNDNLVNALGQGPMQAPSVFNYYSDDYIPNNASFKNQSLVSPEFQIQPAQNVINFSNHIVRVMGTHDQVRIDQYGAKINDKYVLTLQKEVDLVKQELNNDLANIRDATLLEKAADTLLTHLNKKLTNNELSSVQIDIIKRYLQSHRYDPNNIQGVRTMVVDAVVAIVTSNAYMIQR